MTFLGAPGDGRARDLDATGPAATFLREAPSTGEDNGIGR